MGNEGCVLVYQLYSRAPARRAAAWGESGRSLGRSRGLTWRLAVAQCRVGGRLAQVRQDPSTVFVAETLPMKRPVRPPAAGAQQLEAGGRSGEPGVAASCIKTVATSPPPAAAPRSSAASTVSTTQQHEYLGGQRRRVGGDSSSMRGEAFTSGASCSMFAQVCAPRVYVGLVGHFRPRGFWASGQLAIDRRVQPGGEGAVLACNLYRATAMPAPEIVYRFSLPVAGVSHSFTRRIARATDSYTARPHCRRQTQGPVRGKRGSAQRQRTHRRECMVEWEREC